ncbi:S-norcoclaurine synthase 2, partial [Cucurbita argyrosperma subsp. argyrosperma]
MLGKLSHESVIHAPATVAWQLYGGLELARLVENRFSNLIQKIEVVEGDGGEGTILNLIFPSGVGRFSSFKEKFTSIDNENQTDSCIVESTIEYEIKEEAAANASLVNIQFFIDIGQTANDHLLHNKQPKDA